MDANQTSAHVAGDLELVALVGAKGTMAWFPKPVVEAAQAAGTAMISDSWPIAPVDDLAGWLPVRDAVKDYADDVSDAAGRPLSDKALWMRVTRAMKAGRFRWTDSPAGKRIDPTSFAAWRLGERLADLNKAEAV